MKTTTPLLLVTTLTLLCLATGVPKAQAVNPPPDGGYPGGNTAEGQNALLNLTTGTYNTAVGLFSLTSNTEGKFNTATGAGTLLANTAGENTATGAGALLSNTTGLLNTANGAFALFSNTTGGTNTAIGVDALFNNTTGSDNTANGYLALFNNTTGNDNTANGLQALFSNTTGGANTADGAFALADNTIGGANTAIGQAALDGNSTGSVNTGLGFAAGRLITGSGNVCIGASVDGVAGENNITRIRNVGSTSIVGGINVVIAGIGGTGDQILGHASSSRRYKEDIKPMDQASERLFALKPVTFRAKGDPAHVKHYGLIAEDVATADPDLAVCNPDGKPETLRFDAINAMLLNEFLKEHRKVEKLEVAIARQQEQIEALTEGLRKGNRADRVE